MAEGSEPKGPVETSVRRIVCPSYSRHNKLINGAFREVGRLRPGTRGAARPVGLRFCGSTERCGYAREGGSRQKKIPRCVRRPSNLGGQEKKRGTTFRMTCDCRGRRMAKY